MNIIFVVVLSSCIFLFSVLRCLELVNLKGSTKFSDEWKAALCEELNKQGLKHFFKMVLYYFFVKTFVFNDQMKCFFVVYQLHSFQSTAPTCKQTEAELQYRKRDHLSHFILRLAYCRSDELRRWFIARELDLFKLRFLSLNSDEIREFLTLNNLSYSPVRNVLYFFRAFFVMSALIEAEYKAL